MKPCLVIVGDTVRDEVLVSRWSIPSIYLVVGASLGLRNGLRSLGECYEV